ncbi:BQ5605_C007g04773 [Microbotryum silenes-dioicae]|uniref:Dihydrolipoamide acetyltransferase component of pyruvate dehydrogenase complex n=1 Tax=Microbotryum silenes-dioicae TaxID=796604 RepID=A0A2X0PA07_9BASI|nr:BQ5605_C007g04773 [Microbotryum silenes-dioicae]
MIARRASRLLRPTITTARVATRQRLAQEQLSLLPRVSSAVVPPRSWRSFASASMNQAAVSKPFLLADIGEGITEVEIVKWLIEDGQQIEMFDPIVEVMSDKATVEITSPYSGRVKALNGAVGDVIRVGKTLCEVEMDAEEGEKVETPSAPTVDSPNAAHPSNAVPEKAYLVSSTSKTEPSTLTTEVIDREVWATPATRRIAREHSVNLNRVPGTGKDGRVTKTDVLDFIAQGAGAPSAAPSSSPVASTSSATPTSSAQSSSSATGSSAASTTVALTGVRKAMFKAMTASLSIPHFSYSETLDVTLLERLRISLNSHIPLTHRATLTPAEEAQLSAIQNFSPSTTRLPEAERIQKLTLLPLLIKCLSQALYDHPLFLSLLAPTHDALILRKSHDISIALSAPSGGGLYTPLLPNVDSSSPYDLASQITLLQKTVPRFPPKHSGTGSITLSNVGVVGGTTTHPIIPPTGQLAIGAMGKIRVEPRYTKGSLVEAKKIAQGLLDESEVELLRVEPRMLMDVTFSADHRVVEGVELAKLVESWKRIVEEPGRMSGLGR